MGENDIYRDNAAALRIPVHRCSKCGAFITEQEALKRSSGDDRGGGLCEPCTLAQPGSDEFV
jgi:hypothetical protein